MANLSGDDVTGAGLPAAEIGTTDADRRGVGVRRC